MVGKNTENLKKLPIKQIREDIKIIKEGRYPEEETATIGINRGQLFVRIPKIISNRLKLTKGQKLLFKVEKRDGKQCLEVIVQ